MQELKVTLLVKGKKSKKSITISNKDSITFEVISYARKNGASSVQAYDMLNNLVCSFDLGTSN
jgi:hypothetical protein